MIGKRTFNEVSITGGGCSVRLQRCGDFGSLGDLGVHTGKAV